MKKGVKVVDRWWPEWGVGRVQKVVGNRAIIKFRDETRTYDHLHYKFLDEEKEWRSKMKERN